MIEVLEKLQLGLMVAFLETLLFLAAILIYDLVERGTIFVS